MAGKVKENAAEKLLGNPKAKTMFTDQQPGAKAGAAAGNATSATGEAAGGMLRICPENGCQ